MAKTDNLNDFLKDIADAIREKTEDSSLINAQNFADKIRNLSTGGGNTPSRPSWTGHADAEGLRAIGWTDEDIAYYQEHGVNWNEEDDHLHLVSDDNKALYGVLTADNISTYADRIVYLPKIDTSEKTYMGTMYSSGFPGCKSMIAVPQLDTSKMTSMMNMFYGCRSLHCVPELDTKNVTNMSYMFRDCFSLVSAPLLNTKNVTNMSYLFYSCYNLRYVPLLDCENATNISSMFSSCEDLSYFKVKNLKLSCVFRESTYLFSKDSLLYIINNEAATSPITITLATYVYTRLANDPDIVAALAAHPNISIAQ